jgi:hypothetical protein
MKSKWFVWLAWTIVCTVVTAVVTPWEFLSFFFVGGALGIVQWPVLWARFVRLDLWVPMSLLGWFIGTVLAIVVSPLIYRSCAYRVS